MKLLRFLMPVMFLFALNVSNAQDTDRGFTDEDLKKYAVTMDSVEAMKKNLSAIVTEMVQSNTVMSVPRYNELFKIADDTAKLAATNATPAEIEFLEKVEAKREEEIAKMNATYQTMAKDYVGVKQFNAIRKAIKEDEEVKAKYDEVYKEVESKGGE